MTETDSKAEVFAIQLIQLQQPESIQDNLMDLATSFVVQSYV